MRCLRLDFGGKQSFGPLRERDYKGPPMWPFVHPRTQVQTLVFTDFHRMEMRTKTYTSWVLISVTSTVFTAECTKAVSN